MNLNQCPSGICHKGRNRKEQIVADFYFFNKSQTVSQAQKGVHDFVNTKMAIAVFANCCNRGLCQYLEKH